MAPHTLIFTALDANTVTPALVQAEADLPRWMQIIVEDWDRTCAVASV